MVQTQRETKNIVKNALTLEKAFADALPLAQTALLGHCTCITQDNEVPLVASDTQLTVGQCCHDPGLTRINLKGGRGFCGREWGLGHTILHKRVEVLNALSLLVYGQSGCAANPSWANPEWQVEPNASMTTATTWSAHAHEELKVPQARREVLDGWPTPIHYLILDLALTTAGSTLRPMHRILGLTPHRAAIDDKHCSVNSVNLVISVIRVFGKNPWYDGAASRPAVG
ncbi:hypothetical protein BJY52DRAFT_1226220 [Lactarius psammicola]|nr:hypothetical protein BJY52DRAFT_1226220 [Lactarius psammicola]